MYQGQCVQYSASGRRGVLPDFQIKRRSMRLNLCLTPKYLLSLKRWRHQILSMMFWTPSFCRQSFFTSDLWTSKIELCPCCYSQAPNVTDSPLLKVNDYCLGIQSQTEFILKNCVSFKYTLGNEG